MRSDVAPKMRHAAMAPKQQAQRGATFQADVGPGDETGVYYITICNLPFEASWQQLKDWLRPHCEVDHIEVFRTSTSGWVRLHGRNNFDKAWTCLDGGVFHGRSIIASDKNKSEAIKIKELLGMDMNASRERQRAGERPLNQPVSPNSAAMTPQARAVRYYTTPSQSRPSMVSAPLVGCAVLPQSALPTTGPLVLSRDPTAIKPAFVIQHRQRAPKAPTVVENMAPQPAQPGVAEGKPSHSGVTSEPSPDCHRILLKNLPRQSNAADISTLIRRKLGTSAKRIIGVDVLTDDSGVHNRGHAVLRIDKSAEIALVINKLHQFSFRGRTLSASRLDDEEVYVEDYAKGKYITIAGCYRGKGAESVDTSSGPSSSMPVSNGPLVVEGSLRKGIRDNVR